MSGDSRARMIASAAALIGSRGLSGTSLSDVVADSGAPRGSIYHHFPGGKRQLAADAIDWTSGQILDHLRACPATTPEGVLEWFTELWRQSALASGGSAGCPVAGVALDTGPADDPAAAAGDRTAGDDGGDDLIDAARDAFAAWTAALAERLRATGVPAGRAGPVALATLAAMEGALIMCRAQRSAGPLEAIARELPRLLAPAPDDDAS
jgi:AcrR family transcriptional regulator